MNQDVRRLAQFSDTVFAVALVVGVLRLPVPPTYVPADAIHDDLGDIVPSIIVFGITFALIGMLWIDHHRFFDHLVRRNEALLWLNGAFLLCVGFLPFPAGVVVKHPDASVAVLLFAGSMAITGIVWLILWTYVERRAGMVDAALGRNGRRAVWVRGIGTPLGFAISAALAPAIAAIGGDRYSLAIGFWVVGFAAFRLVLLTRDGSA